VADGEQDSAEEPGPFSLFEAAARHGAYRWAEQRLFELTGEWSAAAAVPPAARLSLFEASAQHAWHAQLWAERLPVLADVDPDELTRPLGPALGPLFDALNGATRAAANPDLGAIRFLGGLYRVVLPALLDSYVRHGRGLRQHADAPSIRALALVVRDEEEELAAGEAWLAHEIAEGIAEEVDELAAKLGALLSGWPEPDSDLLGGAPPGSVTPTKGQASGR